MTVDQARLPDRVDVLVAGGGMAGLAAAMVAAENGARVLVIENALYNGCRVEEDGQPREGVEG